MNQNTFRILTLDGGGAKGIYTLGVLSEIEAKLKSPLVNHFDCFYGCSTGAIIAAALAKGKTVLEIKHLYLNLIPKIMQSYRTTKRSKLLEQMLKDTFGEEKFDVFKKFICIVATSESENLPRLFKSHVAGAHSRKESFEPGFGSTIAKALASSCAATPYFSKYKLCYGSTLIDGGFCLTDPTLFAIIDALKAFEKRKEDLAIVSIGTGNFPHKFTLLWLVSSIRHCLSGALLTNLYESHANTAAMITKLMFDDIRMLRINDTYLDIRTNLLETNIDTLEKLFLKGRQSFSLKEKKFDEVFECKETGE